MAKKKLTADISQVLAFPFKEKAWVKKLAIASLLIFISFIPVIPMVLFLGYLAEIIRRIAVEGESPSLPEWEDLSAYFQDGFRLFGAGALYLIPSTVLLVVGYASMFIPIVIMEAGGMSDGEGMILMIMGYLAGFGLMGIGAVFSMVTGGVLPIAGSHVVVNSEFSAAFKLGEIWNIFKANWSGFLIVYLIIIGGSVVLYYGSYIFVATVILCCLYPFVLSFMATYLALVGSVLVAEAYRVGMDNLPIEK
ncbi:MAG: DUF4013 domain-containing protein [Anaerolineales bacterium]|nr:DUF4013 domain-containing protein [Anaerolineales bacterium]